MCKYVNRVRSGEFCMPVYPLLIRSTLLPHLRSVSSSSSIPLLFLLTPRCATSLSARGGRAAAPLLVSAAALHSHAPNRYRFSMSLILWLLWFDFLQRMGLTCIFVEVDLVEGGDFRGVHVSPVFARGGHHMFR
jgi:hypothetical protein